MNTLETLKNLTLKTLLSKGVYFFYDDSELSNYSAVHESMGLPIIVERIGNKLKSAGADPAYSLIINDDDQNALLGLRSKLAENHAGPIASWLLTVHAIHSVVEDIALLEDFVVKRRKNGAKVYDVREIMLDSSVIISSTRQYQEISSIGFE